MLVPYKRDGDGCQNDDDQHHKHQFNQRKTFFMVSFYHIENLVMSHKIETIFTIFIP
jgi:hypothetical protein